MKPALRMAGEHEVSVQDQGGSGGCNVNDVPLVLNAQSIAKDHRRAVLL